MTANPHNDRWSLDDWNITANWVKTYPAGRVCDHDGCATILSSYNEDATCELHDDDRFLTDTLLFGSKRCPTCEVPKPRTSEHFGQDATTVDGLTWECRECHNATQRGNYRKSQADRQRHRYQTEPEYREQRKASARKAKAKRKAAA